MTTTLIKADYHSLIHEIRGYKVMFDFDLASLYGVETKRLKESVRRNIDRFPEDFMIELNKDEFQSLRTQFATSKRGGLRYAPMAFTEQGVAVSRASCAVSRESCSLAVLRSCGYTGISL